MSDKPELQCPFCSSNEIREGFVWTSQGFGGDGLAYLDWAEGDDPPESRFVLGRRRNARIIEFPDAPTRAYRCLDCNSFLLYKLEVDEGPEDQGPESDDTSEPAECLSCGGIIEAGSNKCPKCGWSYQTED